MYHLLKKNTLPVIILALFGFIFCSAGKASEDLRHRTAAGIGSYPPGIYKPADTTNQKLEDAPDFTLKDINGRPFTLSDHEGKVVVLNIWATWCGPCRKEIPHFVEIQEEMRGDDVLFVGVSLDEEGWEAVRPFAEKYEINYPLVVDDGSVFEGYGPFRGIPMTFIINKKGKVEYVAPGMIDTGTLAPVLKKLANR